jgi:glutamine amidotransferase-like uncharacterized protein
MKQILLTIALALGALAVTGCQNAREWALPLNSNPPALILLFNGAGSSRNDVAQFEGILNEEHLSYSLVNSAQLNDMSDERLRSYRLLIVPGGNYIDMGAGLWPATMTKVREAVRSGLNYLGICAGGLLAGDSIRNNNCFNLTSGIRFDFYAAVRRGVHKEMVAISGNGTPTLDQYWEDGPQFTGWGDIVGKYPDGTPAVVEARSGAGWVILSGVHPEAPASWRRGMNFRTPVAECNEYAAKLIHAALEGTGLPHF